MDCKAQLKELSSGLAQDLGCSEVVAEKVMSIICDYSRQAATEAATEVATEAATEKIRKQEAEKAHENVKTVRKILRNYNRVKASVACAVESTVDLLDDTEIQRLMQREESVKNQQVRSLAVQTGRSEVLLAQVEAALSKLKEISDASYHPGQKRQYALIHSKYIEDAPIEKILNRFHIERSIYYKDIRAAEELLAILLFGEKAVQEEIEKTA